MKVIKKDKNGSILIDTNKGFSLWLDVWHNGYELECDWNKYIFNENNSLDMEIKKFQENVYNFDICTSLSIEYYENNN